MIRYDFSAICGGETWRELMEPSDSGDWVLFEDVQGGRVCANDEHIYAATFGSMMARQVVDHVSDGKGAPTDDDMDRFAEEATAVALMTLGAAQRCRER